MIDTISDPRLHDQKLPSRSQNKDKPGDPTSSPNSLDQKAPSTPEKEQLELSGTGRLFSQNAQTGREAGRGIELPEQAAELAALVSRQIAHSGATALSAQAGGPLKQLGSLL